MDEFQSWSDGRDKINASMALMQESEQWGNQMNADRRDNIIAWEQESDQWGRGITAMIKKWNQLNADRDESATDEDFHDAPESSPILPVEETESTIEPSSNPNLSLANEDGPQTDAAVDANQPDQTITGTEEEPRDDTIADATIVENTLPAPPTRLILGIKRALTSAGAKQGRVRQKG